MVPGTTTIVPVSSLNGTSPNPDLQTLCTVGAPFTGTPTHSIPHPGILLTSQIMESKSCASRWHYRCSSWRNVTSRICKVPRKQPVVIFMSVVDLWSEVPEFDVSQFTLSSSITEGGTSKVGRFSSPGTFSLTFQLCRN
uniref:Uncharacterized protein n=1 Tax=Cacopsylla melanoneura TaxID=428564 RepID=A0A8D9B1N0_9HEMI